MKNEQAPTSGEVLQYNRPGCWDCLAQRVDEKGRVRSGIWCLVEMWEKVGEKKKGKEKKRSV
jgi:hypothetical protein